MSQLQRTSRRRFLLLAGGAVGASLLTCGGITVLGGRGSLPPEEFTRSQCGKVDAMKRILVTYASKCGSTGEVAQVIGEVLCNAGAAVDVLPVQDVRELPAYGGIIIGSATRMGKSLPEAVKFAQRNREALAQVPTAYFTVGTTMRKDTPENRARAKATLEPFCQVKEPVSLGLFAGKVDHSRLEQPWRFMVSFDKTGEMQEGDWRDWDAIGAWAKELVATMV